MKCPEKCPQCGNEELWSQVDEGYLIGIYWHCDNCEWESDTLFVIDPAELLDLIEKVRKRAIYESRLSSLDFSDALLHYLKTGDPSALKKLAGIKETPNER